MLPLSPLLNYWFRFYYLTYILYVILAIKLTFFGILILLSDASAIFVFNFNIFLRSTLIWLSPIMLRGYNCFSMIHHLEVLRRFVDFSRKYNICSCFRVSISILVFYSLNCLFTGLLLAIFNFPVLLIVSACRSPQGIWYMSLQICNIFTAELISERVIGSLIFF